MKRMRMTGLFLSVLLLGACALADDEGLSRTSWGRFGWWETSVQAFNRTNIDGLLSYNVTLDGLAGLIQTGPGEQWAGGPPYMTEPLGGTARIWQIKLSGAAGTGNVLTLSREWDFATDPKDVGLKQGWHEPGYARKGWRKMKVGPLEAAEYEAAGPFEKEKGAGWGASVSGLKRGRSAAWENQGLEGYDGVAWYALDAVIPASWEGEKVFFHVYGIDDEDQTFVNGVKIGETTVKANPHAYIAERIYEIPASATKWGERNAFAVRVLDTHGHGGIIGSAIELVRGADTFDLRSIKPKVPGRAPRYIKSFDWVTKTIDLVDYEMTYSLASALVRVTPKKPTMELTFDVPIQHAAFVTGKGVQVVDAKEGFTHKSAQHGALAENWLLVWHGDAVGRNADLPVLVVFHGKPSGIAIQGDKIKLALDPAKPSFNLGPPFGLRRFSGGDTARWMSGLPDDVLAGARFWSRAALAYPIENKEAYRVDHDRQIVTITETYQYDGVADAWGTKPLKVAAVPPVLACLLDAGYPGRMVTERTDPGFITYYGPFAATVGRDAAAFELPIPVEDSLAALETPGDERELDSLTKGVANVFQRWTHRPWAEMGTDDGPGAGDVPGGEVAYPEEVKKGASAAAAPTAAFDQAREHALLGTYEDVGIPRDRQPGAPIPEPNWNPLSASFTVPPLLVCDARVRPGVISCIRRMMKGLDSSFADRTFTSGIWRSETEPTCGRKMMYISKYRYKNLADRYNGEAPYDFGCGGPGVAVGFFEGALWTGRWDLVRKHWPRILQVCDPLWRNHDWASGACDNKDSRPNSSVDITWDHSGALDRLARAANAIGDAKTYDFLCYLRARLALVTVGMEAIQQYLQPVVFWPDHFFVGHVGEPYPPYWRGIMPEGGIAMQWDVPYPGGALNQVPWRFNNANVTSVTAPIRWTGMTQPKQARWFLERYSRYLPNGYDGERWGPYGGRRGGRTCLPPYFPSVLRNAGVNQAALDFFATGSAKSADEKLDRVGRCPALAPWNVEIMTVNHGRGLIQQILATQWCPMWLSAWEPRVIWEGRYDPRQGLATIQVRPGDAPLRLKAASREAPISVSVNGALLKRCAGLAEARAGQGWAYVSERSLLYVASKETGAIALAIRFKAAPDAPAMSPRMVSAAPVEGEGANMLKNASFDRQLDQARRSPSVGAPTGPYLYVNRWLAAGRWHTGGAFAGGMIDQVGVPSRTAGLALRLYAGQNVALRQNVPASPGAYRLSMCLRRGAEAWDPDTAFLEIGLKALKAEAGAIKEAIAQSKIVLPDQLDASTWRPFVMELEAPEGTNALEVSIAFRAGEGGQDKDRRHPVYADDLSLVRVPALSGDVDQGGIVTLAGYAPPPDTLAGQRRATYHLGDLQSDYWRDDPARPADPQQSQIAQYFVLSQPAEIWMIDFFLGNRCRTGKVEHGIDARIETAIEKDGRPVPSGRLAWPGAESSVPPLPWTGKYVTFLFKDRRPIPAGGYYLVLSKKPEDPAKHLHYAVDLSGPREGAPEWGFALWEKEHSNNRLNGQWNPSRHQAFYKVLGRVVSEASPIAEERPSSQAPADADQGEAVALAENFVPEAEASKHSTTGRHLGDLQNDYWRDDPARPKDPQRTKSAQSFVLKEKSEITSVDFFLGSRFGNNMKGGVQMRVETSRDTPEGPVPSGQLAWPDAVAAVPAFPWSGKYITFTFEKPRPLAPGRYWLVLAKEPSDPKAHLVYGVPAGPTNRYPDGAFAEWEKESTNARFSGQWRPYTWNAFFKVVGRAVP